MLAQSLKAPILLGSATPSVESYWLARNGRYVLVTLSQRYGSAPNPEMVVVDREASFKKNLMTGMFSWDLLQAIRETEAKGGQILLFQNRRGFSSSVVCPTCGWTPTCPNCGISLNRHRNGSVLSCHYCGHHEPEPRQCPKCGTTDLKDKGYGTERVVEEFQQQFPQLSVERLDVDSTSRKDAYTEILQRFASGQTRVLVGTQMIAKGLDFAGVALVGVINADNLLTMPDFRAAERAFQLLVQVAGRAGRRLERGKVVLQASSVDAEVLEAVRNYDYARFFERQIQERRDFRYPPFVRIVRLELRHRDAADLERMAVHIA
ncbi:MAG: primosomal protein N', partial [Paludibacteraceae bacterium]|nr:primosomal protein N' [Paludibacteraceae bacterium]